MCQRLVDLIVPFRRFHYYHPEQGNSASLKNVLPAVTGRGYSDLSMADGNEAGLAFLDIVSGELEENEKEQVRKDLEEYCGLDSEGMALIVGELVTLTE